MSNDAEMMQKLKATAHEVIPSGGRVWLYGSHSSGEARPDSDWDLLILLDKDEINNSDEDSISYPFVVEGWKHNAAISPQIYTFKEWRQRAFTP